MNRSLEKRLRALLPEWREEHQKFLRGSGADDAPERWAYPTRAGGYLHDIYFAVEDYREASELYRWRAASLDCYLAVKPDFKTHVMVEECAGVFMQAGRTHEAIAWYNRALERTRGTDFERITRARAAYGFAILGQRELALECIDYVIEDLARDMSRTKAESIARDYEQIRRAEVLFLLRDVEGCRAALAPGLAAAMRVRNEKLSCYSHCMGWYEYVAKGIASALDAIEDHSNVTAAQDAIAYFERALSDWIRWRNWEHEIYWLRMDTLVVRGLGPPAVRDDAYRAYVEAFGETLSERRPGL